MTTIDQRILIPAPSEVVWEYISNIKNNTQWQPGCNSVSFLTSKLSGQGARWRQTTDKGEEQVIEVTAWYDGLGYQYTYIDGMPFRENVGRIRLQEIPEGTIVQWTISYQMGGVLGNMRGALGLNRRLDKLMVEGLKTLWKQVNESGSARKFREAKSLIREAPDAEARAHYVPRHTPVVDLRAEAADAGPRDERRGMATAPPVIDEPPVSEEDTRPRRPITPPAATPVQPRQTIDELVAETEEPEFLRHVPAYAPPAETGEETHPFAVAPDHERFRPPPAEAPTQVEAATGAPAEPLAPPQADEQPATITDDVLDESTLNQVAEPDTPAPAENVTNIAETSAPQATPPTAPPAPSTSESTATSARPVTGGTGPLRPLEDLSSMDTAKLSIWEIFGVPRPGEEEAATSASATETLETGVVEAVTTEAQAETAAPPDDAAEPAAIAAAPPVPGTSALPPPGGRTGLRLQMRRKAARVRRPISP